MTAPERVQSHGPDWSDSLPGEPPSCVCGFNGTPEECAAWRSADGAPDAAGIEAALAAGLGEDHLIFNATNGAVTCTCNPLPWMTFEEYAAHVAAALLPVVTQAQAEALQEAADALGGFPTTIDGSYGAADFCGEFAAWLRARADESGA